MPVLAFRLFRPYIFMQDMEPPVYERRIAENASASEEW